MTVAVDAPTKKRIRLLPRQDEFIFDDSYLSGYGGGWGCGKTMAGILKTIRHCQQRGARFLVGRKNYTDLRDSTLAEFRELYPNISFNKSQYKMILPNKSEILFRHLDDLHSLTNLNLSGFWIEQAEEVPEEVLTFLEGRTRKTDVKTRTRFITFNMEGHNWIWRKKQAKTMTLYESPTYDNLANLPDDYVKNLEKLPDGVKKRYLWGSYDDFEGAIWPMWNDKINVIKPFEMPEEWDKFIVIDHGLTNPTAAGLFGVDNDDNVYLGGEHYEAGQLVSYHSGKVRELMGGKEMDVYIDPSCRAKNGITGTSVIDEYMDHGITAIPANNDVLAGINKVGEFMQFDPERFHPITQKKGSPRFFVMSNCVNAIREIADYRWKTVKATAEDGAEKPFKKKDHMCDVIRYGIMEVDYSPPEVDEDAEYDREHDYIQKAGFTGYVPMTMARRN